jgi:glycosyltransferase involved in cell wall biosynthesis
MKILFVIKALDEVKGGAERVLCLVASGLAARGHDVSVLSFDAKGGQSFYPLDPKVNRICLGIGKTHEKAKLGETLKRMQAIRKTVKNENPDVAVAFMHSAFVPAAFALIGSGIPVIASEHIVPEYYDTRKMEYTLLRAAALFVQHITAVSDNVKNLYPESLQRKMTAISNPVENSGVQANTAGDAQERKTILNVGRLTEQKDQGTLIHAFAQISIQYPDWDLRIIGEGELRPELESLVAKLDLQERIALPGATAEIVKEYEKAQIFALSSRFESFGLVTAEAMSYGLPAIGFADCPGTNELISDGENGLLVNGKDRVNALAQGLEKLINDSDLRAEMGKKGRKSVEKYAPENVFAAWEALLNQF